MIARRPAAGLLAKTSVSLPQQARRGIQQDIAITRTGKPILRTAGGRSSLGGHTATVFGATGFLGRYIVNRLARAGCTVVIPYREEMAKRHLKVTGDLGRVVFTEYDLRNTDSIEESVRHSDMVFNLVGRDYPTKNFDLEDVHVEGTHRIASAVAKYDVDRYIHVSSHSVHPDSPSDFYKTKYYGEAIARDIFPETTIVRPAPMFGFEDRLLHRLAGATNILTANHMAERFWPVHAIDVGEALEVIGYDDSTAGETFEHFHRVSEEIYSFTAGAGRMRLGDEEADVRAGDTVVIAPGVKHKLWNPGAEPLVLLCCCSPAYSHADTVLLEGE